MATPLPRAHENQSPDEHMQISRRFVEHARLELANGERLQASEKIWGAAGHALAAVGKERGWRTEKYGHKEAIANHLSDEFADDSIRGRLERYDRYHANFYQNNLPDTLAIEHAIDNVEGFVNDMENIREKGPEPFTITDSRQIDRLRQIVADNRLIRSLQVGDTYSDGFVNQRRLQEFQRQWRESQTLPREDDAESSEDDAGT